ncbi:MAG: UvrD-helicase domain-containing protein [Actinomycetota bacterium]|nr:UvrD-helicase domain-containing protein [Actinomycetota bacterium]
MTDETLSDQAARLNITNQIFTDHFVVAGAGAGKTSAMITRIINSIKSGVEIDHILAITFTEAAATEIKVRLRRDLTAQLRSFDLDDISKDRIRRALGSINIAPIGTIHSFANALISRYPIEANLPIVFSTADPSSKAMIFDKAIRRYYDSVAQSAPRMRLHGLIARFGFDESSVLNLISAIDETFLEIEESPEYEEVLGVAIDSFEALPIKDFIDIAIRKLIEMEKECLSKEDQLLEVIRTITLPNLRFLRDDEIFSDYVMAVLAILGYAEPKRLLSNLPKNKGQATNWGGSDNKKQLVDDFNLLLDEFRSKLLLAIDQLLRLFIYDVSMAVRQERSLRQELGKITFSDQIRLCYELLSKDDDALLGEVSKNYRVILIDEFQDTDPIQVAIFDILAKHSGATLFFVGDPRQSIYRFRGADPEIYSEVAKRGHLQISLTSNFRSHFEIVNWVNQLFEPIFLQSLNFDLAPMVAARNFNSLQSEMVSVVKPSVDFEVKRSALQKRSSQAKTVASLIRQFLDEEIEVNGKLRKVRPSDIAVLFPTRSILGSIKRSLDSIGVPHRSVGGTSIIDEPYIAEILLFLRAALRPYDQLALVQLIQSESIALGNEDLVRYIGELTFAKAISEGRRNLDSDAPENSCKIDEVLRFLDELVQVITRYSLADGVNAIARNYSILNKGFKSGGEAFLRHYDTFLGYCREFDARAIPAESFVTYIEGLISERQNITEAEGRDVESDAVRLMTIHASKGLEFPIVIVVATPKGAGPQSSVELFATSKDRMSFSLSRLFNGEIEAKLNSKLRTFNLEQVVEREAELEAAEEIRLFYVAATRAMNRLAVVLEEDPPPTKSGVSKSLQRVHHSLFKDGNLSIVEIDPDDLEISQFSSAEGIGLATVDEARRSQLIEVVAEAVGRRRRTTASIELGQDEVQYETDGDTSSGPRSDSIAVGIAVHEVLSQYVSLEGVDIRVAISNHIEGLETEEMRQRASVAIAQIVEWLDLVGIHDPAKRALSEFSFSVEIDAIVHEGVIDLAFMDGGAIQVIDYKVLGSDSQLNLERAISHYELQANFYRSAMEACYPDLEILAPIFLFSTPSGLKAHKY